MNKIHDCLKFASEFKYPLPTAWYCHETKDKGQTGSWQKECSVKMLTDACKQQVTQAEWCRKMNKAIAEVTYSRLKDEL